MGLGGPTAVKNYETTGMEGTQRVFGIIKDLPLNASPTTSLLGDLSQVIYFP